MVAEVKKSRLVSPGTTPVTSDAETFCREVGEQYTWTGLRAGFAQSRFCSVLSSYLPHVQITHPPRQPRRAPSTKTTRAFSQLSPDRNSNQFSIRSSSLGASSRITTA